MENQNKKYISALINGLFILAIVIGIYFLFTQYLHVGDETYTESAQVEEFINPINTRVSAYIKKINFNEHQSVKKGDTLIVLDNREILTQVAQSEANYRNALARKQVAESSVKTIANGSDVMEATISGARIRLWNAEQNLRRYENLIKSEAATQQQYEQIKTEYEAQKATYQQLVIQKKSSGLSTGEAKTKLNVSDAEIAQAKAALEMAKLNLSYTVILAPYNGTMGRRTISEGQLIQAGQTVSNIVLNELKWVTANFLEGQMPKVKIGNTVRMTADALDGYAFEGRITAISAATGTKFSSMPTDNSSGNFVKVQQRIPVRIEFTAKNDAYKIKLLNAGMNMNVSLK